jgi:DNA-binding response OmpR family regulator
MACSAIFTLSSLVIFVMNVMWSIAMKNLQILIITDEDETVAEWNATMQRPETQINRASTWQILTSPAVAASHDIVIVDTDDPDGNLGLCYLLRPLYSGAILLSLKNYNEAHLLAGYAAGADECIAKPIGSQLLWAKMKMWYKRLEAIRSVPRTWSAHPLSPSSNPGNMIHHT